VGPDGTVYAGRGYSPAYGESEGFPGGLAAFSPDGRKKWEFEVELPAEAMDPLHERAGVLSAPTIGPGGTIYVTAGRKLYALSSDGKKKWDFKTGTPSPDSAANMTPAWLSCSPALADDGTIYFTSGEGRLYAVDPRGRKKWHFSTRGTSLSSPAVAPDGTVIFTSDACYAVRADGTQRWRFRESGGTPVIGADGTTYIAGSGRVFAIDVEGRRKWTFVYDKGRWWVKPEWRARGVPSMPNPPLLGVAIAPDRTVLVSVAGRLVALDPDGRKKWEAGRMVQASRYDVSGITSDPPPVAGDGTVYLTQYYPDADSGGKLSHGLL